MIRVIEASSDQELAKKVTEAINASSLPYGDWEYREGRFIVLTQSGEPDGPGGFRLVWGVSSVHISSVAQPLIAQGWLAFGAIKVVNGQYVQALTLGVPAGSGGGITEVYAADIVDSTTIGRALLTTPTQAAALTTLGGTDTGIDLFTAATVQAAHDTLLGGVAGVQVYQYDTVADIQTFLGIGGGGSVTVDDITDAGATGKDVLRTTTQPLARTALGAGATGSALFTAATAANARSMIGAGVAGGNIFTSATTSQAQSAMGGTNIGRSLFTAFDKAGANSTLGTAFNMTTYTSTDYAVPGVGVNDATLRINASLQGDPKPTNTHAYIVMTDAIPRAAGGGNYDLPCVSLTINSDGTNQIGLGSATIYAGNAGISSFDNLTIRDSLAVLRSTLRAQGGLSRVGTNTIDIGSSALPFTNIYLANQPVVTSDVRDKDEVNTIPDTVLDAWGEVDFVQFRRKEGDRIHFGVVAQKVLEVFEKHGLSPFDYGLVCEETWEDSPEELDSNGAVLTPARKAGNRYGVRYQECMILEAALVRRTVKRLQSGA